MAEEGSRRLRPRSAASTTAGPAQLDHVRLTRAATKRSAVDDAKSTVLHPRKRVVQANGKRAPLSDISKQVNAAASGCTIVDLPESKRQDLKLKQNVEENENVIPEVDEQLGAGKSESCLEKIELLEDFLNFQPLDPQADRDSLSGTNPSGLVSVEQRSAQDLVSSNESKGAVNHVDLIHNESSSGKSSWSNGLTFEDIDTGHSDPQMCSAYAADIYMHLRMAEVSESRRYIMVWPEFNIQ